MATDPTDPLDGFRGRPNSDAYEALEDEVRAFRSLADSDVNTALLQDILRMDNLIKDLNDETSTLRRLVTFCSARVGEACHFWVSNNDPTSAAAVEYHRNARAARLVLDWVDDQIAAGDQAEKILMTEGAGDE